MNSHYWHHLLISVQPYDAPAISYPFEKIMCVVRKAFMIQRRHRPRAAFLRNSYFSEGRKYLNGFCTLTIHAHNLFTQNEESSLIAELLVALLNPSTQLILIRQTPFSNNKSNKNGRTRICCFNFAVAQQHNRVCSKSSSVWK